ncbi:DUF2231 domain-containing protein [Williamsia sp. SKLECPSW1]
MDSINGIPAHPLYVHFAVSFILLLAVLGIVTVAWPAARRKLGIIVPIVGLIAVIITPITTSAGEALEKTTPPNPELEHHTELGGAMIYWVAPLFVAVVLYWALQGPLVMERMPRVPAGALRVSTIALAVVTVALSIGAIYWVYITGDSGAQSVWSH